MMWNWISGWYCRTWWKLQNYFFFWQLHLRLATIDYLRSSHHIPEHSSVTPTLCTSSFITSIKLLCGLPVPPSQQLKVQHPLFNAIYIYPLLRMSNHATTLWFLKNPRHLLLLLFVHARTGSKGWIYSILKQVVKTKCLISVCLSCSIIEIKTV